MEKGFVLIIRDFVIIPVGLDDVVFRGHKDLYILPGLPAQGLHHGGVRGFGHGHKKIVPFGSQGKNQIFPGGFKWQERHGFRICPDFGKPDNGVIIQASQNIYNGVRINVTLGQENTAQPLLVFFMEVQGFIELEAGDLALFG